MGLPASGFITEPQTGRQARLDPEYGSSSSCAHRDGITSAHGHSPPEHRRLCLHAPRDAMSTFMAQVWRHMDVRAHGDPWGLVQCCTHWCDEVRSTHNQITGGNALPHC